MHFFQHDTDYFFNLTSPERTHCALVIVNNRLLDYQHKVPAIDLAFCFTDSSNADTLKKTWNYITAGRQRSRKVDIMNEAQSQELKKVLLYFANRTNGSCQTVQTPNRFQVLCQQKIDQYFTRAVVYFLYRDPDHRGTELTNTLNSTGSQCQYCMKHSPDTKKCSRCRKACYCSKSCQAKHWPEHKKVCKQI